MADGRKYYVFCDSNCKFEGMTKEQIITAITQAINTGTIKDIDTGFVTKIKEQNAGKQLTFWVGKQSQYNALTEKDENCFYIIADDDKTLTLADFYTSDDTGSDLSVAAPAITHTIKGVEKSIIINDVSPIPHKCSCKLVSDLSDSKNIYKFNGDNISVGVSADDHIIYNVNEVGVIVLNGYNEEYMSISVILENLTVNETYAFSLRRSDGSILQHLFVESYNASGEIVEVKEAAGNDCIITPTEGISRYMVVYDSNVSGIGATIETPHYNETFYPRLEVGSQVSTGTIKPYISNFSGIKLKVNGTNYTPTADGIVTDIESVSPSMEITTSNIRVNICDVTYCADTKKYIDSKIDQTYNPESENPQSGKAVAEALATGGGNYELIEEITVSEEAIVQRTYPKNYKKIIVVMEDKTNKVPKTRLTSGERFYEFWSYGDYKYHFVYTVGETVVPNKFNNAYAICGDSGTNPQYCLPVTERFIHSATNFDGFKTDNVCKVGTKITVYGVKA